MFTSPLSWLFPKPQVCSAKANAQRIQQETFPVLLLPLRQLLLLLDFKGWVGRGWTTAAHNGRATALPLPKLRSALLRLENKRKTQKATLRLLLLFPGKHFHVQKADPIRFPAQGMRHRASSWRDPAVQPRGARGKGAEHHPAAADSSRSYIPVTAQQHEAD